MAYQPATNNTTSAGLAHLVSVFYKKKGLDRLEKKFVFREACMPDDLPKASGKTVQFFRYSNFTANTTPSVEGTVGTGLSMDSRPLGVTVSQYSSFITVSDLLEDTAIDSTVTEAADLLGYQAGLSVDTMTRNVIDNESGSTDQTLLSGNFMRVDDIRAAVHNLQGIDVQPFDNDEFFCILHPYVSFDVVNDPAANGYADIFKYTSPKDSQLVRREDRGLVTHVAGARVVESTNVKTQTGPNRYRAYVFGKGAVGTVDLAGRGPTKVMDPKKQRFKIITHRSETGGMWDPEGLIRAAVAYNFATASVVLDGPAGIGGSYRYKTLDPQSSIA